MADKAVRIGELGGKEYWRAIGAPLDIQLGSLGLVGVREFADVGELVDLKLNGEKLINPNEAYSRTRVMPVVANGANPVLVRNSILMNPDFARLAVEYHKRGEYPEFLDEIYFEQARETARIQLGLPPAERTHFELQTSEDFKIASGSDIAGFLGIVPAYYETFHPNATITFYNLPKNVQKGKSRVNYVWFNGPQDGSGLDARDQCLHCDDQAFGVRVNDAEGVVRQKLAELKSIEQKRREEYEALGRELAKRLQALRK
jgi:hypothetical protein